MPPAGRALYAALALAPALKGGADIGTGRGPALLLPEHVPAQNGAVAADAARWRSWKVRRETSALREASCVVSCFGLTLVHPVAALCRRSSVSPAARRSLSTDRCTQGIAGCQRRGLAARRRTRIDPCAPCFRLRIDVAINNAARHVQRPVELGKVARPVRAPCQTRTVDVRVAPHRPGVVSG